MAYSRLRGLELDLANAAVQIAAKERHRERADLAEAIGVHAGNRVAEVLARMFPKT